MSRVTVRFVLRSLMLTTLAVAALGVLLRLSVRDCWPVLSTIYYATPLPLAAVLAITIGVVVWRRSRKLGVAVLVGGILGSAWFVGSSHYRTAPPPTTAGLRVVSWNVARGTFGWARLAEQLAAFDADVICLVESKRLEQHDAELRQRLPRHAITYVDGGFTILSRVPTRGVRTLALPRGRAVRFTIEHAQPMHVVLVDVPSAPFLDRGPVLAALRNEAPDLLLGDFNTPRTSVHFDALRSLHVHAFEQAGNGFVETWPWQLPVLDLDHVWVARRLQVHACRYERHWCSDHCAVVVDLGSAPR